MGDTSGRDIARITEKRLDVLVAIQVGNTDKRTLSEAVGVSRSTTRRAAATLEEANLIERAPEYRVTPLGKLALAQSQRLWEVLDPLAGEPALIEAFPQAALQPELLRGAEVHTLEAGKPYELMRQFRQEVAGADRIEGITDTVTSFRQELFEDMVTSGDVEITVVVDRKAFEELAQRRPALLQTASEHDTVESYVVDTPRLAGLNAVERDGKSHVTFAVHDELGGIVGLIHNERAAAVEWARDAFQACRAEATPKAEVIDAVLDDCREEPQTGG